MHLIKKPGSPFCWESPAYFLDKQRHSEVLSVTKIPEKIPDWGFSYFNIFILFNR